ncbi:MAG TPA: carboxypeptidase-like regulatory domain-containing protein [Oscillatoriaceae cyanobacterium]
MIRRGALLAGLLVLGCAGHGVNTAPVGLPVPVSSAFAAAEAGAPLPAGTVVGLVARADGTTFSPAPGVTVNLDPGGRTTRTDLDGHYRFDGLAPGTLHLSVQAADCLSVTITATLGPAVGLPRVNLPLVPKSASPGIAGVVCDPRGCALPNGTVHEVDALTTPGIRDADADADGFFAIALTGARGNGAIELQGHGTTPGGLRVESTTVQTLAADGTLAVQVGTDAFSAPTNAHVLREGSGQLTITADGLPTRPDELSLRVTNGGNQWTLAPDRLADGELDATLPAEASGEASATLRPFDRDPPTGPVTLRFTIAP